jgi:hypothetical protein
LIREQLTDDLVQWIQNEGTKGTIPPNRMDDHVVIGHFTETILTALNVDDLEIVTSISVLEKMMFDHGISAAKLKSLHQVVCTPVKIFRSATHPAESVVLLSTMVLGAKPVLIPVRLSKPGPAGKAAVHWISSAYVKEDPTVIQRWETNGLLIWQV